ncbi:uncharacterized protein LOC125680237 [Ostrea edulis]|uniref:uncharacterized protein LOC125680237 n=1 Tax=Ostrea edulis TaxID=37623 RepID=UPI0024AE9EA7|nr:uncharacterized protein LOC125680237 [Ostrea edulis]
MISILDHIHENYVPHTAEEHSHVIRKKVFGGDVLTNERAYSAQLAMLNGATDFEQIAGVIHRPEGLHRMMNLCLVILYQQFYKASSTNDRGTLSQLRNIVHRVDVKGAERVIESYRAHSAFIDDCLDAFIVGACMHHLKMESIECEPQSKQILFEAISSEDKMQFIANIASEIQKKYINLENDLHTLEHASEKLDMQEQQIKDMFDATEGLYHCVDCRRPYKKQGHLKNHLKKEHDWEFHHQDQEAGEDHDRVALYRASFMKCALLLRDTSDAYKLGDGNRIMDNSKFQMLLSGIAHHTKYQLWLFRFLANYHCLLSPREAFEYKWNCTTNMKGGCGDNIPNDNLVEILVHRLKSKLQSQGANVTFSSARKAALTLQIQDEIKENLIEKSGMKKSGTTRSSTSMDKDIVLMVTELSAASVFDYIPGRKYDNFKNFNDLFSRINIPELHKWLSKQKERLSYEAI